MAVKAKTKAGVKTGEYRTNGERLVRVVDTIGSKTWVEDGKTLVWEEMVTEDLAGWDLVKEASDGE